MKIKLNWEGNLLYKDYKELKSARDPNVGPPDRPGSRVHCPAPVLTRPLRKGKKRKREKDFMSKTKLCK